MDWNNDGKIDLLAGDSLGRVVVYINTSNGGLPVLSNGTFIQSAGSDIDVGERAAPEVTDWDNDGRKDLLIGRMDGRISIYINKGTDREPLFDKERFVQLEESDFDAGSRSAPRVIDWNRDGLKDILTGEHMGYVLYLRNYGKAGKPLFRHAEKLYARSGHFIHYGPEEDAARSRLYVTDWNNDGLYDLLLGGWDGRILLFLAENKPSYSMSDIMRTLFNQSAETFRKFNLKTAVERPGE